MGRRMTRTEAGAKGGQATVKKYGKAYMQHLARMLKVCFRKLSAVLPCGVIVSHSRLDGAFKNTKIDKFFAHRYFSGPSIATHAFLNSLKARCTILSNANIHTVLGIKAVSKIMLPVVKFIPVGVVCVHVGRSLGNLPVHVDPFPAIAPSDGVATIKAPFPLTQPFIVFVVHNGIKALCERYFFHVSPKQMLVGFKSLVLFRQSGNQRAIEL